VGVYYFRQATALPEWYDEEAAALEVSETEGAPAQWVALDEQGEEIEDAWPDEEAQDDPVAAEAPEGAPAPVAEPKKRPRKKAKKHELRGFHRRSGKNSKGVVRASRAVIEGDKLEAGVILDLSKLPKDDLVERDRKLYERAVSNFPGLTRRNVYVGIEDRPATEDGMLRLGDAPRVRIGNLHYSLPSAARKLGMTPAELRTELDRELRRMKLEDPR
jgi:hypothetical protein